MIQIVYELTLFSNNYGNLFPTLKNQGPPQASLFLPPNVCSPSQIFHNEIYNLKKVCYSVHKNTRTMELEVVTIFLNKPI